MKKKIVRASGQYIYGNIDIDMDLSLLADNPACNSCRACVYDSGRRYRYCFFTGEYLYAFDSTIGANCPVNWKVGESDD